MRHVIRGRSFTAAISDRVLSYLTTQRTPDIGLRIAVGAQRSQLLRLVLVEGLRPASLWEQLNGEQKQIVIETLARLLVKAMRNGKHGEQAND
jgi:CII-binding regulator of phage lambda lysogenization HflD